MFVTITHLGKSNVFAMWNGLSSMIRVSHSKLVLLHLPVLHPEIESVSSESSSFSAMRLFFFSSFESINMDVILVVVD